LIEQTRCRGFLFRPARDIFLMPCLFLLRTGKQPGQLLEVYFFD
jgi:hypothetical protein